MKSMHLLLTEAEHEWRDEVKEDFPLRSTTPVIRNTKPDGRDWTFSTDLNKIFASIGNDEALQRKFETEVRKYWDGKPEEIALDVLHYLLHHELYHPIEAPFSVSGDDNDNKRIHQAIRQGIIRTEPQLTPLEQIVKVQATQNGIKDFILDNRFSLDNSEREYVRDDVIPIWDFLELLNADSKTNFYTITRLQYGILYGPSRVHDFFEGKAGKEGHDLAERALSALLQKTVKLPKIKKGKASGLSEEDSTRIQEYVRGIREVFSGKDRYAGIERFMSVLAPYVEKGMPQSRPDLHGEGAGTSPQNILQDLLDDMSPEEQATFVSGLTEQEDGNQFGLGQANSITNFDPSNQEMNTLDVFAIHEYYKRNHPRIRIVGENKVGEAIVTGQQEYWHLQRSRVITEDELAKVNLQRIATLQRRTRLPWLIDLNNGTYRLNEYEPKKRDIKDIVYADSQIDVPDEVDFYLDSSGSMYQQASNFGFNDGSSWDMLSNVLYGFIDALVQAGKVVGKQTKIRIHNVADRQVNSQTITAEEFMKGNTSILSVLFKPENGYGVENLDIQPVNDGRKRAYVVVTDGNLVLEGRTGRESAKMLSLARNPNNSVVLFEIGGTYGLGNAVKNDQYVRYHPVHDKQKMLEAGLEVLLAK